MVRRLILLWIACVAVVTMMPLPASASAHRATVHAVHAGCCPDRSGHPAPCADHDCASCALGPVADHAPARFAEPDPQPPVAARPVALLDHRIGSDPPPPRPAPSSEA